MGSGKHTLTKLPSLILFTLSLLLVFAVSNQATSQSSIAFVEPLDGDAITLYTYDAVIPETLPAEVEISAPVDTETITISIDGIIQASALPDDTETEWQATVDLMNADGAGVSNPFNTVLDAVAVISGYYSPTISSDSIDLTITILDSTVVDTIKNGDPVPDDDSINLVLESGGVLIHENTDGSLIKTALVSISESGTEEEIELTLSNDIIATVEVESPPIDTTGIGPFQGANNVVMMLTVADMAADLTSGYVEPDLNRTLQNIFARLVILIERPTNTWVPYTGALPAGFTISIEIDGVTPTASAGIFQFNLNRIDGEYFPVTNAAWIELDAEALALSRALITDGDIEVDLTRGSVVLGVATGGSGGSGSGSSSGGGCFIATAAFGTPLAQEIDTLRHIRDTYMLNNLAGSIFVDTYYRLSPPIADQVAKHQVLAGLVRTVLTPIVAFAKLFTSFPAVMALVSLSLITISMLIYNYRTRCHKS